MVLNFPLGLNHDIPLPTWSDSDLPDGSSLSLGHSAPSCSGSLTLLSNSFVLRKWGKKPHFHPNLSGFKGSKSLPCPSLWGHQGTAPAHISTAPCEQHQSISLAFKMQSPLCIPNFHNLAGWLLVPSLVRSVTALPGHPTTPPAQAGDLLRDSERLLMSIKNTS